MTPKRKRFALMTGALATVTGLGLLLGDGRAAQADPPDHAPAWGWRRKHGDDGWKDRQRSTRERRRDDDDRWFRRDRRERSSDSDRWNADRARADQWRTQRWSTRFDWDHDGVKNRYDRFPRNPDRR